MNRLFAIATRHLKPLLGLNLLLFAGLAYAIQTRPTSWQANAKLIVPSTSGSLDVSLGKLGQLRGSELEVSPQLNPLTMMSSILLSDDMMTELWKQDPEVANFPTVEAYAQLFTVSPEEGTTILTLGVGGDQPALAEERLARLIKRFRDRLNNLRQSEAGERSSLTKTEAAAAKARLVELQAQVAAFQQSSGLISSETQTRTLVESLSQLKSRYTDVRAAQLSSEAQLATLQQRLDLTPAEAVQSLALGEDETYKFLRQQIVQLDVEIAAASSLYVDDHPQVALLVSEREKLRTQEAAQRTRTAGADVQRPEAGPRSGELMQQLLLAEGAAKAYQQEATELQKQIQRIEQRLQSLPAQQAKLDSLQRDYENAESIYNGLVAKAQESNLNAFSAYPSVQILDQPNVSAQPLGPKLSFMVLGALLASALGSLALVLLLESRNPLLSPADVFAADLPVLGAVPLLTTEAQLLQSLQPPHLAFQRLASAISMMELSRRRILISSAMGGEGKTAVTVGLGRALAALGFRVLLVDGDFSQAGLTRQLQDSAGALSQTSQVLGAPVAIAPNLDLMPTAPGQANAMAFLARGDFDAMLGLAERAGHYDYLLVDSAPMALSGETSLMGTATENVMLVARAGFSERDQVYRTLEEFARHRVRLLGLILNQATDPKAAPKTAPRATRGGGYSPSQPQEAGAF